MMFSVCLPISRITAPFFIRLQANVFGRKRWHPVVCVQCVARQTRVKLDAKMKEETPEKVPRALDALVVLAFVFTSLIVSLG